MLCDQNNGNGGIQREDNVIWMSLCWYWFVGGVVGYELVVHARDWSVVNLCFELNAICRGEGESCVNVNCDFVYY